MRELGHEIQLAIRRELPAERAFASAGRFLGALLVLLVTACGGESFPAPGYKPYPPLSAGNKQPVSTASLSGRVYAAEAPTLDTATQLPMGYKLLSGDEGRVTVRIPGPTTQTRVAPIKNGSYEFLDLPIGVKLEVVASSPGYASRRQQVEILLPAGRRLNFDHDPDGSGTYLMPLQDPPAVSS
ncbi:hypothetical protein D3C87_761280 [compost metagenome]